MFILFLPVNVSCSNTIYWKGHPLLLNCFCTLSKISWAYLYGPISKFSVLFHWSTCLETTKTTLSWLLQLYSKPYHQVEWFLPVILFFQNCVRASWWCSGWESACQCSGHGFGPWSGKIPHATEQMGPWATTTEPARLEPVLRNKRGRESERPAHREEEWPPLAATREKPSRRNKDPTRPKININK